MLQKPHAELHPIPVTKVWHRVGIDLVGPLPETRRDNKYIITLSDYFSKWPEAAPLQSKEATGVASFLLDTFCRHGWPKIVQSDQGREFVNTINSCLFEMTGVKQCIDDFYWKGIHADVKEFCKRCEKCQRTNHVLQRLVQSFISHTSH